MPDILFDFTRHCNPAYYPARLHKYLADTTSEGLDQGGLRLIVNMPPRHGKSRLFAIETVLWQMARRAGLEAVVASYALDLAERHSRQARLQALGRGWPLASEVDAGRRSVADWALTNGSSCKAVGVGGALTGHGADLLILDDLHKDAAEACSSRQRENVWQWLQSVALTRLSPRANVILIGTRWHLDDVTGRLLARSDTPWRRVNLPAIAERVDPLGRSPGEPLWPERFPLGELARIRAGLSAYHWAALYEGSPVSAAGQQVEIARFRLASSAEVPSALRWVRFWDLAVTDRTEGDHSAGALCGRDGEDHLWIVDMARGQWDWTRTRERIRLQALADRCQTAIESVGTQKGLIQNLREVFPSWVPLTEFRPEKDKFTRALPWFTRVNEGKVHLVHAAWNAAFLEECQAFPLGAHDDQVDAVSGAAALLYGTSTPGRPRVLARTGGAQRRTGY